jgi:hypothetical protein
VLLQLLLPLLHGLRRLLVQQGHHLTASSSRSGQQCSLKDGSHHSSSSRQQSANAQVAMLQRPLWETSSRGAVWLAANSSSSNLTAC